MGYRSALGNVLFIREPDATIWTEELTEQKTDEGFRPVKSALRTLEILTTVSRASEGMTFADIERAMGWPRSSTYNLLQTLTEAEFLDFDEVDRKYRVGIRLWEAGQGFSGEHDLVRVAKRFLADSKAQLNETVQLAILDGIENVYVAKEEANHHLKLVSEVGSRLPAYATGLGKALLAGLSPEEVRRRFDGVKMVAYTDKTITSVKQLEKALDLVRHQGYSIDESEFTNGVYCVAVPVRGATGEVVAAISSSVPEARVDDKLRLKMVEILSENARRMSAALGYQGT